MKNVRITGFQKERWPQHTQSEKTIKKAFLCVWWNNRGIMYHKFMTPGEIINTDVYSAQLERVHSALLYKQPSLITRRGVILQNDNARPHIAQMTQL